MTQQGTTQFHAHLAFPGDNRSRERWLTAGVAAFLLGLYALFLCGHVGAYAGGTDSSGYLNNARLLGRGATRTPERVIPGVDDARLNEFIFVPVGFQPAAKQIMAPGYATGVPLSLLLVSRFTGWEAAPAAMAIVFSLLGILVTAWLGREFGLPGGWAWAAAALLAIAPNYINMSLQLMSDVPATVFCAAAIVLAWKSRARPAWAAAAGAVFAGAVLVRPNNLIMLIPAAICLGLAWRRWGFFGLGGLPGAVFFCCYNFMAYGKPLETGYGNVTSMFTVREIPEALAHYAHWLPFVLTPAGLLAFGLPFLLRRDPARVTVLLSWIFVVLGFYALDSGAHMDLWILRYLLPAFPPIMVGGVRVLKTILDSKSIGNLFERVSVFLPRVAPALIIWAPAVSYCVFAAGRYRHEHDYVIHYALPAFSIALAIVLASKIRREKDRARALLHVVASQFAMAMVVITLTRSAMLGVWTVRPAQIAYPNACAWAKENLPANAVIYSMQTSGALYYYTPFTLVRWDHMTAQAEDEIERACAASGRPIYAMLFPEEVDKLKENHFLDRWKIIAAMPSVTCWRLDPGKAAPAP